VVRAGMLSAGLPAQEKKELSGSALQWTRTAAAEYQQYRIRYTRNIRAHASAP
jgi:carbonic anhydrase/acetyltransferase-like protein (isoleucine patch superfamily)